MSAGNETGRPGGTACDISTAIKTDAQSTAKPLQHPRAVAPAYVVFTFHDDGKVKRRNVYLSLHSAIKAKERAEAKGSRFELMLCELVPVKTSPLVVVA